MKMILHHLRKDIHAQRWLLLLWGLVAIALALPDVLILQPDYDTARFVDKFRMSPLSFLVGFIAWTILLARLVQMEPITGSISFWLTRPIPKSVFLGSKSIFLVLLIILPSFVPTLFHMLVYPIDWDLVWSEVPTLLVSQLMVGIVVVWLATYTPTLLQFAGMLCLGAILVIFLGILSFEIRAQAGSENLVIGLTCLDVIIPGLLLSLVVQHCRPRVRTGFYVGIFALILGAIVQCLAPIPRDARSNQWGSMKRVEVAFAPDWADHITWGNQIVDASGMPGPKASALLVPTGVDINTAVWTSSTFATFQQEGESPVTLGFDRSFLFESRPGDGPSLELLRGKLPGVTLTGNPVSTGMYQPVPLFSLDPNLADKLRGKTGKLVLKVMGQVASLQAMAVIPLSDPHYIARIPGGFLRLKPLGDDLPSSLTLWKVAPSSSFSRGDQDFVCVLVDPQTHSGSILSSTGYSFTSGSVSESGRSLTDTEMSLNVRGNEIRYRMMLYVFEFAPTAEFRSTLTAPNFKMTPPQ